MNQRADNTLTPLLEARGLTLRFPGHGRPAVDGVSFSVAAGRTLGLVGASGAGKSSVARILLRLHEPDSGAVLFKGEDVLRMDAGRLLASRRAMQPVFQEPSASLSPRRTVAQTLLEPLDHFAIGDRGFRQRRVREILAIVGLDEAVLHRYPHQLSAGQQQRIAIGRALVTDPELIIADEPVSSLDVSVQAQVLALFEHLKREYGIALLFISHDLAVVSQIADEVAVMHRGQVLETAPAEAFFAGPAHPYSQMLLAHAGDDPPAAHMRLAGGMSGAGDLSRCVFLDDCPAKVAVCERRAPGQHTAALPQRDGSLAPMAHYVRCHLHDNEADR
jgi:oligopeptide/dipeptide ABC transporter ATP-binding protein